MLKFGKGVVKSRFIIFIAAILLLIPSVFGYLHTRVNYDILTYLPEEIETMKGQDLLLDEFGTGAFSFCVVEGMDAKDISAMREQMEEAAEALEFERAAALRDRLSAAGIRVSMDDSDQSAGWKFAQYEMKGVPLRVEIGPKDMEKQQCCIARRDTGEKTFVPLADLESAVQQLLRDVHDNLYAMAEKNLEDNTFDLTTWEEVRDMAQGRGGFARTKWCGSLECELAMKEKAGVSSRCMPLKQSGTVGKCPVCGKECTTDIYWGVAY
mgnify:CR=1 FL=1